MQWNGHGMDNLTKDHKQRSTRISGGLVMENIDSLSKETGCWNGAEVRKSGTWRGDIEANTTFSMPVSNSKLYHSI